MTIGMRWSSGLTFESVRMCFCAAALRQQQRCTVNSVLGQVDSG